MRLLLYHVGAVMVFLLNPGTLTAQHVHANVRVALGGTDDDYPGCHGRLLAFGGGSVEVGSPVFVEVLGELMGAGGEDCLPGIVTSDPNQPFASAVLVDPTWRASLGVGRNFLAERFAARLRGGAFMNTREPFASANASVRLWIVTFGIEVGRVRGHWTYEDGTEYKLWSTFGGWSLGLRF